MTKDLYAACTPRADVLAGDSRDPSDWCALASYGHPGLLPALERAVTASPLEEALVLAESPDPVVVAAYRADRTPPEPVRTIADLAELGPASAMGEAQTAAADLAETVSRSRRDHVHQLDAARSADRRQRIRRDFVVLARGQLEAEWAIEYDGGRGELDHGELWSRLTSDTLSGWTYAETFRQLLDVSLADLAPQRSAGTEITIRDARRLSRQSTYGRLAELMVEWRTLTKTTV